MTKIVVPGPFEAAAPTAPGAWRLCTADRRGFAAATEIYVHGAGADAAEILQRNIASVSVEWLAGEVKLTVMGPGGTRSLRSQTAMIHQPRPQLYDSLPLAIFDASAQRFWKRVFRLIRIPGGRYLLGWVARANRHKRSAEQSKIAR